VKGHAEQAVGSVKNAANDMHQRHVDEERTQAHDVRERVTSTAQNVKERIDDSVDSRKNNR
jgi:uncharacterized protein YjbJ (UPF0337 family)